MRALSLPFPVPLRALFVKSKGGSGIPSKRYQAYGREAAGMILSQGAPKVTGPVRVEIQLCAPDRRKRDGDNLMKCLFDTLVTNRVIEDDSNAIVRGFSVEWVEASEPCRVSIESAETPAKQGDSA